ncbi:carbohydrate ABC transporter permease [Microbacterium sp.]|uniref:carbohydrate ABC transporter permease n=1 Tax=Microbacterium sp. TaxID=51671 RepID=UPI00333FA10E
MTSTLIAGQQKPALWSRIVKGLALAFLCFLVLFPFLGILSTSLATNADITDAGGFVVFPRSIDFGAYVSIFSGGVVTQALAVSVFVTVVGTLISLVVTTLLAYALSRPAMVGRNAMLLLVLMSLLFSPGLIPSYLMVKNLGLLNNIWALILPVALGAFNVVIVRAFFMNIPQDIIDSARIDGAGDFRIFARIVLPLSKAVLAVVGLFYAVGYWNSFFTGLLYLSDTELWPLQLVLRTYVVNQTQLGGAELNLEQLPPQPAMQMAILVISIVPILCLYPFLQKHFAKGMLTGAVKG